MILIVVPSEGKDEKRVALSPETAKKFIARGCDVVIEKGAGLRSDMSDADFEEAGARISSNIAQDLAKADIVLGVNCPASDILKFIKKGAALAATLNPTDDLDKMNELAKAGLSAFAMEFMPRITRAQSMDVLSSQSNLSGYKAVIDAAAQFNRAMPMMMTAAGTVPPARVFVMGAGVAGLQAIATARRLGAIVTATDVRPAAKEQVESLAGKFIAVEDEEFKQAETSGGYAKEMSNDYKKKQAELVAKHMTKQDMVITTALIPGRPAPKLISKAMVESMPRGAVIVDLAAERGGNCELTKPGEIYQHNGVTIMGKENLAGELSANASSLYARNLLAFLTPFIDEESQKLAIDWEDELVVGTLICHEGKIVHERLTSAGDKK
ncbi:MAG: Re/Si-specific NAD(P)(+) transhydrogenase subunit alpha [Hyphomicrobiaceae bacterium]|nr:Re/Si-specific NAD(P)(+) transhydrogenase subunit alpha [Hyphomicrobiaceae bacterium]